MRGFLAIARREFGQRRLILSAAAFASLIPLLLPVFRHMRGVDAADARGWTALIVSAAFGIGLSVALGASMLVPATASRGIGFDFTRPLSGLAIWAGRIVAAIALVAATALILWAPAWLAGAHFDWKDLMSSGELPPGSWPLWTAVILVTLFSLFHALTLMFRSRSGLLALDAAMALAVGLGIWAAFSILPFRIAIRPLVYIAMGLGLAKVLVLPAAGLVSVVRGRTEIRAAHRALSLVVWSTLGGAALVAIAYASWVMAARPADFADSLWAAPAASGPWVVVSGTARGAEATFLYDTTTGRHARALTVEYSGPVLSRDGKRSAWVQGDARGGPFTVWTWRLDETNGRPAPTRILLSGYPSLLELSADGSRLATMESGVLSIHDLASSTTVATARAAPTDRQQALRGLFVTGNRFRFYRIDPSTIDILELDASTRTLTKAGTITGLDDLRSLVVDHTGDRLIVGDGPNRRTRLFDGRTGELFATLADSPIEGRWPSFLSGERIVLAEKSSTELRLLLFESNGERGAIIPLPAGSQVVAAGEALPGQLVVGITDEKFDSTSWIVDLETAAVRKIGEHLWPVRNRWSSVEPGSDATKLFYGPGQRSLVRLDPLTGQRKALLGTRP